MEEVKRHRERKRVYCPHCNDHMSLYFDDQNQTWSKAEECSQDEENDTQPVSFEFTLDLDTHRDVSRNSESKQVWNAEWDKITIFQCMYYCFNLSIR